MSFVYICNICGDEFTGDTEKGLAMAVKQHYMNQHGIQYEAGPREANLQYSEEEIRKEIKKE